ncbi:MAG TPA: helix-turn-helix domain-containing protein [Galbitalea sp.]
MASLDLLLHPVRLRIIQAFLGDRALTTGQLAVELPDVPAGSLYRHIALLSGAGVLQVVAERQVRGSIERTYTMRQAAARLGATEAAAMSLVEHRQAFTAFVAGLLGDFDRYLASGSPDFARDGVGYSLNAMWLTDPEYSDLIRELVAVLEPRFANPPRKGRKRRIVASVFLPGPEQPPNAPNVGGAA